jgi:hypothetical protein
MSGVLKIFQTLVFLNSFKTAGYFYIYTSWQDVPLYLFCLHT